MQTHVYSLSLASYKLFTPVHRLTDVIIIRGDFDHPADNDEIARDRQYTRTTSTSQFQVNPPHC
ncbi:hypothetical protein [Lacticaseibacillus zhaodongensis]|uniref:hypothetical protein n=1 Tax=Lacticaseibacillus zhaodongensis TaxID=2668065 RepID=UPI0012D2D903|nr:hypothetical protein [Lacticaseibacillus zhaodongensis]